jgi:peptide subunit release factor 1 (eRF1)
VDLVEELMRLTARTGGTIEIIHTATSLEEAEEPAIPKAGTPPPRSEAAALLDPFGGVGALLRFTITPD